MISIAIMITNKNQNLNRLVTYLTRIKAPEDEIIIASDFTKNTHSINNTILNNKNLLTHYEFSQTDDTSAYVNFLFQKCKNSYILYINADEMISENCIQSIKSMLKNNPGAVSCSIPIWDVRKSIKYATLQTRVFKNDNRVFFNNSKCTFHQIKLEIEKNNCIRTDSNVWCIFDEKIIE